MSKAFLAFLILLATTPAFAASWQCGKLTMAPKNAGVAEAVALYVADAPVGSPNTFNPVAGNETVADFITANSNEKDVCFKGSLIRTESEMPNLLVYEIKLK